MIFVTVGNSHYPFTRLLGEMDEIAPALPMPVRMQTGCADFRPRHAEASAFLTFEAMMARMAESALIIGHASAGPILHARKFKVPLILVPRRPELGEHVDGHQVETGRAMEGQAGLRVVWEVPELQAAILSVLDGSADLFRGRSESGGSRRLIETIRAFVNAVPGWPGSMDAGPDGAEP